MITTEGERVWLREYQLADLDAFHRWISDPEIMRFISWKTESLDESLARLTEAIAEQDKGDGRTNYYFALIARETNSIIGGCGFTEIAQNATGGIAEIGYFLYKEHWGQGYASEAARHLIRFCFDELKFHKVRASCAKANTASERVMLRSGMSKEGEFRQDDFHKGIWMDRVQYAIVKDGLN